MLRLKSAFPVGCVTCIRNNCAAVLRRNSSHVSRNNTTHAFAISLHENRILIHCLRYLHTSKVFDMKQELKKVCGDENVTGKTSRKLQEYTSGIQQRIENLDVHMMAWSLQMIRNYNEISHILRPNRIRNVNAMQSRNFSSNLAQAERLDKVDLPRHAILPDMKSFKTMYPQPKYSLNHIFITLATHFRDNSFKVDPYFVAVKKTPAVTHWRCTYSLKWPESCSFSAEASTKQEASAKAALLALHHLYSQKNIKGNAPVLEQVEAELKEAKRKLSIMKLNAESESTLNTVVQKYESQLLPLLSDFLNQNDSVLQEDQTMEVIPNQDILPMHSRISPQRFQGIAYYSLREDIPSLPINDYK